MATDERYRIEVQTQAQYVPEQSDPDRDRYFFAYTITIRNTGSEPARLLTRHWIITHGNGQVHEVRGDGVIGEQPHLSPGESFQYTSAAMIETALGVMHGSYQMVADDGTRFEAPIAPFRLSAHPTAVH